MPDEYALMLDAENLLGHPGLSATELVYALAISQGKAPEEVARSERTRGRALASLTKKKIIKLVKKAKRPGVKQDGNAAFLSLADDLPELESFAPIDLLFRDDRFRHFCRLWGVSTEDPPVRNAWLKLERKYKRDEPGPVVKDAHGNDKQLRIPEIAQLCPCIYQATQLEAFWQKNGQRPSAAPGPWLDREAFNDKIYRGVELGDPVPEGQTDEWFLEKVDEMLGQIANLGASCLSPAPGEGPHAQYKRVRAVLAQSERNKRMDISLAP